MFLDRPILALATFALALTLLLLLDRLRRRPVVLVVASLELFRETAETAQAAARARRRRWRDLVLKLLASLAFAVAAGGPELSRAAREGRLVRIVLARGASLAAVEADGRTRLEAEKTLLRGTLAALADEDTVALVLAPAGDDSPPTALDRAGALAALERVTAVDAPSRLEETAAPVLAAAAATIARDPAHALPALVVTDREPDAAWWSPALAAAGRTAIVGSPRDNLGIVALGSARGAHGREQLLVALRNATDRIVRPRVLVRLAVDADALARERLLAPPLGLDLAPIGPGAVGKGLLEDDALPRAGAASATLDRVPGEGDALAVDDGAVALRAGEAPLRIAVVGDLGRPLETALRATDASVTLLADGDVPLEGFDLTILRYREGLREPRGAAVYVCPPRSDTERARGIEARPLARELVPDALAAYLAHDLEGVAVSPELPPSLHELEAVLAMGKTPIVSATSGPDGTPLVVALSFELPSSAASGWAHEASFPRFWADILERVRARPSEPSVLGVFPTGIPLSLPRPPDAWPNAPLAVVLPTAPPRTVRAAPWGRFVPLRVGVHRVRAERSPGEAAFSAALLDPETEDLRGARARGLPSDVLAALATPLPRTSPAPLAFLVAFLGLLLAGGAWILEGEGHGEDPASRRERILTAGSLATTRDE